MTNFNRMIFTALLIIIFGTGVTAQQKPLEFLYHDPSRRLAASGFDTTDYLALRRLIDTTSEGRHIGSDASIFLAQRGVTDIFNNIQTQYYMALDEYLGFAFDYLYAVYLIDSSMGHQMVYDFIDTTMIRISQLRGPAYRFDVYRALRLLVNVGDYSRFSIFSSLISEDKDKPYGGDFDLLHAFANKPELRDSAYGLLTNLIAQISNSGQRWLAVRSLSHFTDMPQTQQMLQQIVLTDTSWSMKDNALQILFSAYNDYFVLSSYRQTALVTADILEYSEALWWIGEHRSPLALFTLKDVLTNRSSGYFHERADTVIRLYRPKKPPKAELLTISIDSLVVFKHQVSGYAWLDDKIFVNELDSSLTNARNYLLSEDSNNCARQIKIFQQKVDEEYRDSLDEDIKRVTIEGWKFLYYNAQYILARLPVPPTQFNLTINTVGNGTVAKSPDQSIYDSASTVQFTATPGAGYTFSVWSGDAAENANPLTVTMNSNKSIIAIFTRRF